MNKSIPESQHESQPDHHPFIQDFLQWTKSQGTYRVGCGGPENDINRKYISLVVLKEKLNRRKIEELLEALFENWEKPAPDPDWIKRHYLRPFAILLCIGEGRMIYHFVKHQRLQDHLLPFPDEPHEFPSSTRCNLYTAFRQKQWAFCAVRLEYNISSLLGTDEILPIVHKERIEDGGSAVTYKIVVDDDYDELVPRNNESLESQHRQRNTYVIKTYRTREAQRYYETERDAFMKLRWDGSLPSNIIGFYGSFVRGETYNIILEYADLGNLDYFMEQTPPPSSASEKTLFWDRFFDVGNGLVKIHGEEEGNGNELQILLGWHQDVHPGNILVVSGKGRSLYDCHFKLADLGLSHFKRHVPSREDVTDRDTFGTNAYGAPETRRFNAKIEKCNLKVKQSVDVWSLGCVFSEVATWVDQGWNKVVEYRRRRSEEMEDKTGQKEDCFHHGLGILNTVTEIHHDIMQSRRVDDFVTPAVVNDLVGDMLLFKSESRPPARYIYDKSRRIIDNAQAELKTSIRATRTYAPPQSPITERKPRLKTPPNLPPGYCSRNSADISHRRSFNPSPKPWSLDYPLSSDDDDRGTENALSDPPSSRTYPYNHHDPCQGVFSDTARSSQTGEHLDPQDCTRQPDRGVSYTHRLHDHAPEDYSVLSIANGSLPKSLHNSNFNVNARSKKHMQSPSRKHTQRVSSQGSTYSVSNTAPAESLQGTIGGEQSTSIPPKPATSAISEKRWQQENNMDSAPSHPESAQKSMPHPQMTVDGGLTWKIAKHKFPHEDLFESLKQRDHAFLVDNADSMSQYRPEVKKVLELLSYMVGDHDPDGLDLYFTTSPKKLRPKNEYRILQELESRPATGLPDIRQRFANILEKYQSKFGKINIRWIFHPFSTPFRGPRKLSLYVLTDGVWQPNTNLHQEIRTLVQCLIEHKLTNKQIGIQFIRFGHNWKGMKRLEKLDYGLNLDLDLIDTTPANGNVWKMLLGSINPWFDDDDNTEDDSNDAENEEPDSDAAPLAKGKGKGKVLP